MARVGERTQSPLVWKHGLRPDIDSAIRLPWQAQSVSRKNSPSLGQTCLDRDLEFKTLGWIGQSGISLLQEAFGWSPFEGIHGGSSKLKASKCARIPGILCVGISGARTKLREPAPVIIPVRFDPILIKDEKHLAGIIGIETGKRTLG